MKSSCSCCGQASGPVFKEHHIYKSSQHALYYFLYFINDKPEVHRDDLLSFLHFVIL